MSLRLQAAAGEMKSGGALIHITWRIVCLRESLAEQNEGSGAITVHSWVSRRLTSLSIVWPAVQPALYIIGLISDPILCSSIALPS